MGIRVAAQAAAAEAAEVAAVGAQFNIGNATGIRAAESYVLRRLPRAVAAEYLKYQPYAKLGPRFNIIRAVAVRHGSRFPWG